MVALDPRPFRCGVGEDVKIFFFFFLRLGCGAVFRDHSNR